VVVDTPHVPDVAEGRWSALARTHVVQEFAPGTEYATAVYAAPSGDDGPDLVVVLEKAGRARAAAVGALAVERVDGPGVHDVASVALLAARALGLVGPVSVDVRRLADGRPVVLDVDARFVATSPAAPELLDRVLAGCRPRPAVAVS
jgi:carbamoyl-phosphate synthase large subunit